jgi:hypothetical protein
MTPKEEHQQIIRRMRRTEWLLWWMVMLALLTAVAGFLAPVFLMIRSM